MDISVEIDNVNFSMLQLQGRDSFHYKNCPADLNSNLSQATTLLACVSNNHQSSKEGSLRSVSLQESGQVSKMAPQVKALVTIPDHLSWIPGAHVVKGESQVMPVVL